MVKLMTTANDNTANQESKKRDWSKVNRTPIVRKRVNMTPELFKDVDDSRKRWGAESISDYFIALHTKAPKPRKSPGMNFPEAFKELMLKALAQLGWAGSNLNQIARQVNTGRDMPLERTVIEAAKDVTVVTDMIKLALGIVRVDQVGNNYTILVNDDSPLANRAQR